MKTYKYSEVGGNHYERFSIEPVHVMIAFNCNWFQGEALKYISRFMYKSDNYIGQVSDLNKAIHILSMAKELNPIVKNTFSSKEWQILEDFKLQYKNDLSKIIDAYYFYEVAITHLLIGSWDTAINSTISLLNVYSTNWYEKNH